MPTTQTVPKINLTHRQSYYPTHPHSNSEERELLPRKAREFSQEPDFLLLKQSIEKEERQRRLSERQPVKFIRQFLQLLGQIIILPFQLVMTILREIWWAVKLLFQPRKF
jgi:hypothetical protein